MGWRTTGVGIYNGKGLCFLQKNFTQEMFIVTYVIVNRHFVWFGPQWRLLLTSIDFYSWIVCMWGGGPWKQRYHFPLVLSDPKPVTACSLVQLDKSTHELDCTPPTDPAGFVSHGYTVTSNNGQATNVTLPVNLTSLSPATLYTYKVETKLALITSFEQNFKQLL